MILKDFGVGWQEAFEGRLQAVYKYFPDTTLQSAIRYLGMLRVKFTALDTDAQSMLDSITYKIERESTRICEKCGAYGRRQEEHLPEKQCLCWKCYALTVDELVQNNNLNDE
jgi:hypothetical protein